MNRKRQEKMARDHFKSTIGTLKFQFSGQCPRTLRARCSWNRSFPPTRYRYRSSNFSLSGGKGCRPIRV